MTVYFRSMTHSYMVIQYTNTDKIYIFNYKINCINNHGSISSPISIQHFKPGLGSSTVLVLKYIFISTWVLGVWKCPSTCTWPKSTWYLQVIFKYYLLKSVKIASYLNTLLWLFPYLVPTTDSIVCFVASLA